MPGRKNYLWENSERCWKSIGILSNTYRYKFRVTLALVDELCLYIL